MIKILLLIAVLSLFFVTKNVFQRSNLLLSSGFLLVAVWAFILCFYLLFDDGMCSYEGIIWILICLILHTVTFFWGNSVCLGPGRTSRVLFNKEKIRRYVLFFGFVCIAINLQEYLQSGGWRNAAQVAFEYYTSDTEMTTGASIINQIRSVLVFSTLILGGVYSYLETRKRKIAIGVFVFIAPIIGMLTTSGKLGLINAVIFYVTGYMIAAIKTGKRSSISFYLSIAKKYWIVVVLLGALLFFSFLLRYGSFSDEIITQAKTTMLSYAFGSPAAFNNWFSNVSHEEISFGKYTFTSIAKLIGATTQEKGVYTEMLRTKVWTTNVYSVFRATIMDYGLFFGCFFWALSGAVSGIARKRFVESQSLISCIITGMGYLFVFFSIFNSPFVYLNLTIAVPFTFIINHFFLFEKRVKGFEQR